MYQGMYSEKQSHVQTTSTYIIVIPSPVEREVTKLYQHRVGKYSTKRFSLQIKKKKLTLLIVAGCSFGITFEFFGIDVGKVF